jgi:hypothetical protein
MSSSKLTLAEMMTPVEMMADAFRLRFADQQTIKALEQQINALEQENKELKKRLETLTISQEGQSVVALSADENPSHRFIPTSDGPYSSHYYTYTGNYETMEKLVFAINTGSASGHIDDCAICDGYIGDDDCDGPFCDCDQEKYPICSCGIIFSQNPVEAREQFRSHLDIIKNEKQ